MKKSELIAILQSIPDDFEVFIEDTTVADTVSHYKPISYVDTVWLETLNNTGCSYYVSSSSPTRAFIAIVLKV